MSDADCLVESVDKGLVFGVPWVGIRCRLSGPIGMFVCARSARVSGVGNEFGLVTLSVRKKKLSVVVWYAVGRRL